MMQEKKTEVAWETLAMDFKNMPDDFIRLILIRGLPGSGKTTLAKVFEKSGYKHFEADMYFTDDKGNYNFAKNKLRDAHRWCREQAFQVLDCGGMVVVSNTFTEIWEMEPYIKKAIEYSFAYQVIKVERAFPSVHPVPDAVKIQMAKRFEPFCEFPV